ncbi:AraC family transcriptional regulator [Paenibacillus sp. sgz5001063]|uniref:AraC family transcriptional regulator n=1 Tax=Paenibacillus sp. sgz5001063 TaxID=3242474 RepID=UPI0036D30FDD
MDVLEFTVPPLPHYIISGLNQCQPGYLHPNRQHIQVFDLLIVRQGCLYIGEEDRSFTVNAGEALLLRPDSHHYGSKGCREDTAYYWLHFQTSGYWRILNSSSPSLMNESATEGLALMDDSNVLSKHAAKVMPRKSSEPAQAGSSPALHEPGGLLASTEPLPAAYFGIGPFTLRLSQFITLLQPARIEELLLQLEQLKSNAHLTAVRFRQQILFQEILQQLAASNEQDRTGSQSTACAEQAASFLRTHYREEITTARLGESLNFHPVYIARCMNREYGCSPIEYLIRYRIEQSKLLLMQTSFPIARIAEEVGFNQAPYFSASFMKLEGLSPRQYRQRFS